MAPVTGGGFVESTFDRHHSKLRCPRYWVGRFQITAAYDAIEGVTEVDGEGASARRACQGSVIAFQVLPPSRVARILAIVAPPVRNPSVPPTLCCDARPLDAKENSPGNAGGIAADILPGCSVGCAQVWEHSIHRIAVCNAAVRRPEGKAVVEGIRILVSNCIVQVAPPSTVL